eukprot:TRINITY_DN1932_c0_g12_i1.p2 TRINITY_DN1932_c0_g12~~TRINITY_DN1932_c0_g12_i1.p2  ORF type:complete len:298 (-),score=106.11 TRINITY_DN1932_c0_g12_i1:121-1014(-)
MIDDLQSPSSTSPSSLSVSLSSPTLTPSNLSSPTLSPPSPFFAQSENPSSAPLERKSSFPSSLAVNLNPRMPSNENMKRDSEKEKNVLNKVHQLSFGRKLSREFGNKWKKSPEVTTIDETDEVDGIIQKVESIDGNESVDELKAYASKLKELLKKEKSRSQLHQQEKINLSENLKYMCQDEAHMDSATRHLLIELDEAKKKLKNSEQLVVSLQETISMYKKEMALSSEREGERERERDNDEGKGVETSVIKGLISEVEKHKKNLNKLEGELKDYQKSASSPSLLPSLTKKSFKMPSI